MRRRDFIIFLAGAMAAWPLAGRAQQQAMPVIGVLSANSASASSAPFRDAFRQGLSEAGYVEGENVAIEYRWAEDHYDRLPALAADLVGRKIDLIAATGGNLGSHAAKNATSSIPIVFNHGGDPVAAGLIASLARPGGNLTGISFFSVTLSPKRLEFLSELVPNADVIAALVNPASANTAPAKEELTAAARAKGLQLTIFEATTAGEIDAAFNSLMLRRA